MGLLTDRINNKLDKSNLINEHALNPEPVPLGRLNTVLPAVSGNSREGMCFKLDKQTWRRKSYGTQGTISKNQLIKILRYLAEFSLLSYSETSIKRTPSGPSRSLIEGVRLTEVCKNCEMFVND